MSEKQTGGKKSGRQNKSEELIRPAFREKERMALRASSPPPPGKFKPTTSSAHGVKNWDDVHQFTKNDTPEFAAYREAAYEVVNNPGPYPEKQFSGRGIVTVAGGAKYFPPAYVMISMLRKFGCTLPIQVFYLGSKELTDMMQSCAEELDFELVDVEKEAEKHSLGRLGGWQAKPAAVLFSRFREVLFLDGDNVPVRNPDYLFKSDGYTEHGAVFWPDIPPSRLQRNRTIWTICGVPYRDEPEFESGQLLLDKRRCWTPLQVTLHMNMNAEFYYHHIWGDKDTWHMAWHMCRRPFAMIQHPVHRLKHTMCQHDFQGRRLFQHRNNAKWSLDGNIRIEDFLYEQDCLHFLARYARKTVDVNGHFIDDRPEHRRLMEDIGGHREARLHFLNIGRAPLMMKLCPDLGIICADEPGLVEWHLTEERKCPHLTLYRLGGSVLTFRQTARCTWEGWDKKTKAGYRLHLL